MAETSERLLLRMPPRPLVDDWSRVVLAVTDMYPGLMADALRQADDGWFEVWVPADARPIDKDDL